MMPFGKRAVIGFEHGAENLSTEHYEAVTYWYGLPAPSLIKTDEVDVGSETSEKDHNYSSPEASKIETITSRYESGIDVFPNFPMGVDRNQLKGYAAKIGKDVYPAHQEDGRFTRGISEFTM
jgi:hypothetical protein